ncbi:aldo/keto reductase [Streptomyces sp. NPDC023723]|uniref:aldo/keto reductase n=1 Tax=Streptomyces sp. NPDC023723 TaxID=3154323 RepID=UPI0033EE0475
MTPPAVTLNTGARMPTLGLGTWQVPDSDTETVVKTALTTGYRSIDTATSYRNERGVGTGLRACGLPREDVFVTTKLWNADHGTDEARRAFDQSLERLGLEWVDLYLIHWPLPMRGRYVETWKALEGLHAEGRARAIGVSNFTAEHLRRLMAECDVVPAVNQVELHPLFAQRELRAFHAEHGIVTQAWSPLGSGQGLLDLPELTALARRRGLSTAQVVLRWHLQSGHAVIPRSADPAHLAQNAEVFGFTLDDAEMAAVDSLDTGLRRGPDPDTFDYG